ncbi:MAG: lactate dehydrogenase, partial [Streptococcaceae bacterium]|nr:lactate dehydrogenase [Streptococcaceae bacterium]
NLYPRVLITPHIGSFTDEALMNMIETSMENLEAHASVGSSVNDL